jgi:hypothetical protein
MQAQPTLNSTQVGIIRRLHQQFGVDPNRVKFLDNGEPWLPADVLSAIGRATGQIKTIDEDFSQYIPQCDQVVHKAVVIDAAGNAYGRSGVATIGERLPEMDEGEEVSVHDLAASRAIVKALTLAGVNPFKSGAIVTLQNVQEEVSDTAVVTRPRTVEEARVAEAASRHRDLARIHILAVEAGLVTLPAGSGRGDDSAYRKWLAENFQTETAAVLSESERAQVIAALEAKCREIA